MGNVLITASHYTQLCREAKKMLEDAGHTLVLSNTDMPYFPFEQLCSLVPEIDAAIIGMEEWNEQVFTIAPKLKGIARFGVGIDNIDLNGAKRHGIKVTNALGQNANAVAELAVGYIFLLLRDIHRLDHELHEGRWQRFVGRDLKGKTIGLIGFGDIARRIAKKLSGFDAHVIACDISPDTKTAEELDVRLVKEQTLLSESDVVSIHIPNTPKTAHYMNKKTFSAMKKGAVFINTARGMLVDTEALCDAVDSGHLGGAAVDVYEDEPLPKDSRILHTEKIICTPHTGAETYETYTAVSVCTAQAVIDILDGKEPKNWVNQ